MVLSALIQSIGYLGVAAIVFAENGLLIGFFLPGDSLLFTAGFLASQGFFDPWLMTGLVIAASIIGTQAGYVFGSKYGRRLFNRPDSRFFKQENLRQAEAFYERHGGKTIILARFVPVVRTFAPIVAGIGQMSFRKFLFFNLIGGILWGGGLTLLGYWLGSRIPSIDKYILPVIALIIILSVLPGMLHMLREPERRRSTLSMISRLFKRKPK